MNIFKFKGEWALLFLFILLCICGYTIYTQSQTITETQGQRDRLSDYIREYTDMQYSNDTVSMTVAEFVKSEEIMDNNCDDLGFKMKFDNWYFAY